MTTNMRACLKLGLVLFGVAACAAAEARIVYVTPSGAGKKNGENWLNARSSVMEAYNDAAKGDPTPDAPNEVWIRYGTYPCYTVTLQSNVVVRGGFDGTEIDASQADPDKNPTILHNGSFSVNETWTGGYKMWSQAKDGRCTFYDPPESGDMMMYRSTSSGSDGYAFQRYDGQELGVVEFHGLTFTKYMGSAVRLKSKNERPAVFRKCRFLNLGWVSNNRYFVVEAISIGVDMEDCEFVGAQSPLFLGVMSTYPDTRRTNILNRCRFSTTIANGATSWSGSTAGLCGGGVVAKDTDALIIKNCTFDRNISQTSGTGSLYLRPCGDVTIENTVIRRGYGQNQWYGGAVGCYPQTNSTLTIRRCRFERCHTKNTCTGAALTINRLNQTGITHLGSIEDTAFVGNYVDSGAGNNLLASTVMFVADWCKMSFVNCLFEGNTAVNPTYNTNLADNYKTVCSWSSYWNNSVAFVNCTFKDNVVGYKGSDGKVNYSPEFGPFTPTYDLYERYSFVNTVFENANTNQPSWRLYSTRVYGTVTYYDFKSFSFANCVTHYPHFYGTTTNDFWRQAITNISQKLTVNNGWNRTSNCYRLDLMASNVIAGVEAKAYTNGAVIARRLASDSQYRHASRPIWKATNGQYYMYDVSSYADALTKPWVPCLSVYQYPNAEKTKLSNVYRLTEEEAAAIGLSTENEPIRDAFGGPRGTDSALGPLHDVHRGLRIGVRGTFAR